MAGLILSEALERIPITVLDHGHHGHSGPSDERGANDQN
jgi:hypothetical protein